MPSDREAKTKLSAQSTGRVNIGAKRSLGNQVVYVVRHSPTKTFAAGLSM
jgi:hypothetical protein